MNPSIPQSHMGTCAGLLGGELKSHLRLYGAAYRTPTDREVARREQLCGFAAPPTRVGGMMADRCPGETLFQWGSGCGLLCPDVLWLYSISTLLK
jgi:hypothetical protein